MKKLLVNEQGFTLLLSVLIGVLFSIFAVSLITYTSSGIDRNNFREDTQQAIELADKGLTYEVSDINAELMREIGDEGIPQLLFIDHLERILEERKCGSIYNYKDNVTGEYSVCITNVKDSEDEEGNSDPARKEVTFRSIGKVDGVSKYQESTVIIGAQSAPDALNYAIGVNCSNPACGDQGEGNLFLHGGVQIRGDLKVDGNIVISDKGYAFLNGDRWIPSLKPNVESGIEGTESPAKLVLGGEVYTFNGSPSRGYDYHLNRKNFNDYSHVTNNINEAFLKAPEIVNRTPIRDEIVVTDYEQYYKYTRGEANEIISEEIITGKNLGSKKVYPYATTTENGKCIRWFIFWCSEYERIEVERNINTYEIRGNNAFKAFSTDKNIRIRSNNNSQTALTLGNTKNGVYEGGMYIGGDLTIGNTSITSHNTSHYDNISISGNIYVDGDLTIRGANIDFNSIIYVTGEVNVQYSTINGIKNASGREGSLILFADRQIYFANNSVNQSDPSNIRGFFYSNDKFEMFGVGSNIRIVGGISARRIVLNAIRGRASDSFFTGSQNVGGRYFESLNSQTGKNSRLQVIYNNGIIGTYSDLILEEHIIKNVETPRLIKRD